jgi:hypothetical protein
MKGSVVQKRKGSRHWYAIIERRDEATGKRVRKWISLEATGKRQAQIECARIITELKSDIFQEPSKITLAEFLERWLDHMKSQVSPRSHERYAEIARKNIAPYSAKRRCPSYICFKFRRRTQRHWNLVAVMERADYRRARFTTCIGF